MLQLEEVRDKLTELAIEKRRAKANEDNPLYLAHLESLEKAYQKEYTKATERRSRQCLKLDGKRR